MMQPKRTKYRKRHKERNDGLTKAGAELNFGAFGMKATTNARDHRASDRGGAAGDHAPSQARRPGLDPDLPGPAGEQEAGRGAHGQGQGLSRVLGGAGQGRPDDVRDRRRAGGLAQEAIRRGAAKLPLRTRFVARVGEELGA